MRLFKLLGGCGGLSFAADLVLLDEQLHKPALMLGCVFGHLPEICQDTGGQQVGTDKVRRTVAGALLIAAANVTVLFAVFVLIPLLVQHMEKQKHVFHETILKIWWQKSVNKICAQSTF